MKLLHVITTLDVGGAEMHLLSQVRGQCARGHTVRVAYLKGEGRLADDFRAAGAEWIGSVGVNLALIRQIRWSDIVHSHLLKADALTAVLATLCGRRRRLVSGKHNDEQVLKKPLVSLAHGLLGNLPTKTIVLSDHVGRFVAEHGRVSLARQERIYYGLDPEPFETARARMAADTAGDGAGARNALRAEFGFGPDDIVFICVARFAAQKAHDVLLSGFALAREAARERAQESQTQSSGVAGELRLLLVGGDPFGDGVERARAHAETLDLGAAVCFAGIRRDVPDLLAISDVFVMSSLWEGLGLVFLEPMATELPVLATRVSAVPEVVVEGETGVLVKPADAEDLARGFEELAGDAELRARLGAAGARRVAERFGLDRMVEDTLAVYERIVSAG